MWGVFKIKLRNRGIGVGLVILAMVTVLVPVFKHNRFRNSVVFPFDRKGVTRLEFSPHNNSSDHPKEKDDDDDGGTLFVVNTPTCKIPDLNPWDEDVKQLSKKCEPSDETDPKCEERQGRRWMYTQNSALVLNSSAVLASGYSLPSIRCCYYVIHRVEQSLENFDENADYLVRYSQKCRPISLFNVTSITDEFIRVFCFSTDWPMLNDVVYREYFAFAQPDAHARKKVSQWNSTREVDLPPNIVILGLDTNSRLNSRRRLPQTLAELQKIDAVEFFGYTKIGENTLPNTVAFLGGMTEEEMMSLCYPRDNGSFDTCPFLWKDLDRAGYLTATAEESPLACSFNYFRNGFVRKPTDFYYRPFTLAAVLRQKRESYWFGKCIGRYISVEVLLNYLNDILRRGSRGAPVFIHSWLSVFSHGCINSVRFEDGPIAQFIHNLDKNNTILIFMSDHGDRHGAFRETSLGWYEDKLPTLWVYLPERVRRRYPGWQETLRINARRLTSHFDLYHTFVHILHEYRQDPHFRVNTPRKKVGQSLLEVVPQNRTCDGAGISNAYCACTQPQPITVNTPEVRKAAECTIAFLKNRLPFSCAPPVIQKVVAAKLMTFPNGNRVYVVSFYTDPGHFLFEATVTTTKGKGYQPGSEGYLVESFSDILRMNKITRKVDCVKTPVLERYCYCL